MVFQGHGDVLLLRGQEIPEMATSVEWEIVLLDERLQNAEAILEAASAPGRPGKPWRSSVASSP